MAGKTYKDLEFGVRVFIPKSTEKVLGVAEVSINGAFVVKSIFIRNGKNGAYPVMPARLNQKKGKWEDLFFPITAESRKLLYDAIMAKYNEVAGKSKAPASPPPTAQELDEVPF